MAKWWLCLAICLAGRPALGDGLPVIASIVPLKFFVERVGGEHVSTQVLVGPGHSPATYEPTPRQLEAMSQARLFFRVGVPYERRWMAKFAASSPSLSILDAREGLALRGADEVASVTGGGAPGHVHEASAKDPHVWLSPPLAREIARRLRDRLALLDPVNREQYEHNFTRFAADLDELDSEIREMMRPHQGMHFLVFHPAWGYFADTYGLRQIAVEAGGRAPGPKALSRLVDLARTHNIGSILVERQFAARTARAVAAAIGGQVVVVDPLSEDYLANLRAVARLLTRS